MSWQQMDGAGKPRRRWSMMLIIWWWLSLCKSALDTLVSVAGDGRTALHKSCALLYILEVHKMLPGNCMSPRSAK